MNGARVPGQTPDASARTRAVLDLAIRLAMVQLGAGAGAQDASATMTGVSQAYGLRGTDASITHTEITLSWTNPATDEAVSRTHILTSRRLDYQRLSQAAILYTHIVQHRVDLVSARRHLRDITARGPHLPGSVRTVSWGVLGAGAAVMLGGGAIVAVVAFAAAIALVALTGALQRRGVPLLFRTFLGGIIGPVAAVLVHAVSPEASATLVVVATIIVLLAGVTVFGSVQDIITEYYITGLARLTEALVATGGLTAGVIAASLVLNRLGAPISISVNEAHPENAPLVAGIAAVVMVLGFSLAAQMPWRALWAVCLLGAIAEAIYVVCSLFGIGPVWASALAAVGVGFAGTLLTRVTRTPVLPLIVAAVVPLLPGLVLFNGIMELASSSVVGLLDMFRAAAVAGALAAGAIFGHYIVKLVRGDARTVRLGKM